MPTIRPDTVIAPKLLDWFKTNRENYPFRDTKDAYKILVCEILLRKTRAKQVSDIYEKFFAKFPTVEALAYSSVNEILEVIRPLGIWRRAYDLSRIAREIVDKYRGKTPDDLAALTSMKGVGRYIASCVLASAHGKNMPMVDSNVERVICRLLGIKASGKGTPKEDVWIAYSKFAPTRMFREFHYAMIDLAHKICRPENPMCDLCPSKSCCCYAESLRHC